MAVLEGHSAVTYRGHLYLFGGRDNVTGQLLNTLWQLDIREIAKARLQKPDESATLTAAADKRVAPTGPPDASLFGGDASGGKDRTTPAAHRDDVQRQAYAASFTNPMPVVLPRPVHCTGHVPAARCYHQCTLRGQFMLVLGGTTANDAIATGQTAAGASSAAVTDDTYLRSDLVLYGLNLDTLTWNRYYLPGGTSTTPVFHGPPLPRCHGTLVSTPDTALLYGGFPTDPSAAPAPNHWSLFEITEDAEARAVPSAGEAPTLWGHTACFCHGCLFVFGGVDATSMAEVNTVAVYSFAEHRWRWADFALAPEPRALHSAVMDGSRMYVFGGFSGRPDRQQFPQLGDLWRFCLNSGLWEEVRGTGDLPNPRSGHAAVLQDGMVYIIGGLEGNASRLNAISTLAAFDTASNTWSVFRLLLDGATGRPNESLSQVDPASYESLISKLQVDQSPPSVWPSLADRGPGADATRRTVDASNNASPRTAAEWKAQALGLGVIPALSYSPDTGGGQQQYPRNINNDSPAERIGSIPRANSAPRFNANVAAPPQGGAGDAYYSPPTAPSPWLSTVPRAAAAGVPSATEATQARLAAMRASAAGPAGLTTPAAGRAPSPPGRASSMGGANSDMEAYMAAALATARMGSAAVATRGASEAPTNAYAYVNHPQQLQPQYSSASQPRDDVAAVMQRVNREQELAAYNTADTRRDTERWQAEMTARSHERHPVGELRVADLLGGLPHAASATPPVQQTGRHPPPVDTSMTQGEFLARLERQRRAAMEPFAVAGGKWWEGVTPDGRRRATAEEGARTVPGGRPAREYREALQAVEARHRHADRADAEADLMSDESLSAWRNRAVRSATAATSLVPGSRGHVDFVPAVSPPLAGRGGPSHDGDDLPPWASAHRPPRQHSATAIRHGGDDSALGQVAGFVARGAASQQQQRHDPRSATTSTAGRRPAAATRLGADAVAPTTNEMLPQPSAQRQESWATSASAPQSRLSAFAPR
jgi:hypothetical protein